MHDKINLWVLQRVLEKHKSAYYIRLHRYTLHRISPSNETDNVHPFYLAPNIKQLFERMDLAYARKTGAPTGSN